MYRNTALKLKKKGKITIRLIEGVTILRNGTNEHTQIREDV